MNANTVSETFRIPAAHPALPGHFPGQPLVPGVVLLDRVVAAIERALGLRVCGFAQVKFLHALAPECDAILSIERNTQTRFRIASGDTLIASGVVELGQ